MRVVLLRGLLSTKRSFVLRLVLASLWFIAGWAKLSLLDQFKDVMKTILPGLSNQALAMCLIVIAVELLTGAALLIPRFSKFGALSTCALSSVFAAVNLIRINEGLHAPCSCFGKIFVISPVVALALDVAMLWGTSSLVGADPAQGVQL